MPVRLTARVPGLDAQRAQEAAGTRVDPHEPPEGLEAAPHAVGTAARPVRGDASKLMLSAVAPMRALAKKVCSKARNHGHLAERPGVAFGLLADRDQELANDLRPRARVAHAASPLITV